MQYFQKKFVRPDYPRRIYSEFRVGGCPQGGHSQGGQKVGLRVAVRGCRAGGETGCYPSENEARTPMLVSVRLPLDKTLKTLWAIGSACKDEENETKQNLFRNGDIFKIQALNMKYKFNNFSHLGCFSFLFIFFPFVCKFFFKYENQLSVDTSQEGFLPGVLAPCIEKWRAFENEGVRGCLLWK